MVFRTELTYTEIEYVLNTKFIATSSAGCTLPPGIYEIMDISLMLHTDDVKVNIKIDNIRLRSKLSPYGTIKFLQKYFYPTILGFTQSHSGVLGDIEGSVQLIPGSYKSDKPDKITGIEINSFKM